MFSSFITQERNKREHYTFIIDSNCLTWFWGGEPLPLPRPRCTRMDCAGGPSERPSTSTSRRWRSWCWCGALARAAGGLGDRSGAERGAERGAGLRFSDPGQTSKGPAPGQSQEHLNPLHGSLLVHHAPQGCLVRVQDWCHLCWFQDTSPVRFM